MNILITARKGFIAKNLFEQLGNEYELVSLERKDLDLLDYEKVLDYLKNNNFDVVIHTATYDTAPKHSTKDPAKVLENHLKMFFNLARCEEYFGKMIFFGSGAEYDREHWVSKMKEDYFDRYVPKDQYGFAKYLMTKYALLSKKIYNLRLFGIFGKYDDFKVRIIPNLCRNAALDLPLIVDQNKYYDFLYVNDLVKIIKWFINNTPNEKAYNVCTGEVVDFKTIAEKISKISGKDLNIEIKKQGLGKEYSGDNSLLLSELGDFQFCSLDESMKNVYEEYNQNKEMFSKKLVEDCYGYA